MAINGLEKDSALQDREQKTRLVAFRARIDANATPASKVHQGELPNVAVLRSEGKTAEADAVEDLSASFATAADATGVFGILLKGEQLGPVDRIFRIAAVDLTGGTVAVTAVDAGGAQDGISPEGNLALDVDWSGSLATTDADILVVIEYYLE